MDIQKPFLCALFAALIHVFAVKAQIPLPCANETSITNRECCPIIPDSGDTLPCGEDRNRGECVDITSKCNQFSLLYDGDDVRGNWPHYFTRGCRCSGNFGGYHCGECKFGWKGDNCMEEDSASRLSIADILYEGSTEWNEYVDTLLKAKNFTSTRYVVLTTDASPGNTSALINKTRSITIYDLFVWYHHYVAKENVAAQKKCAGADDYAHEKVGFLTWHRLFLLWFEREIQIELKKPNFKLYYWDWRGGAHINELLTSNRFGEVGEHGSVTGNFWRNWTTVCWEIVPTKSNCDPDATENVYTELRRCPSKQYCSSIFSEWPTDEHVNVAVGMYAFDSSPYNVYAASGLRNYLEGFKSVHPCTVEEPFCDTECGKRLLHNSIHLLLGYGQPEGVMANLAASPNDPLFLNHHTMIDCIFEEWLQEHTRRNMYPEDVSGSANSYTGHRVDDCIVPFFPLYTHRDMFQQANRFGYSCALPNINPKCEECTQAPTTAQDENDGDGEDGGGGEDGGDAASRLALYSITILLACLIAILLQ